ncbi:uncharacterized protein BX663DRAFT_547758 [Cokeromyces recurvatus]|uniref:uncharacterized protein n=1 Tax=Cokeromyces recurvatus TaxID=90255 RepID=UPI0022202794|nr:uncharacterized protein BX663DRAFT_547758 [Cokeromyces recurvatus]KAI7908141.1 hypothetical protein BX663DRAFT_547758 [Cokeromyces recurvatus]
MSQSHTSFKQDPYRATRKTQSPDGQHSYYNSVPSINSEQLLHSRSASESSSTTRLATTTMNNVPIKKHVLYRTEESYYEPQDPYAPRIRNEDRKQHHEEEERRRGRRKKDGNSYLPYSNHRHDPYNSAESIFLQEDNVDDLPSFNSPQAAAAAADHNHARGPVGSILQDNINMDMMNDYPYYTPYQSDMNLRGTKPTTTPSVLIQSLPPVKKKKWWERRLGMSGQKLVFILFIFISAVGVIWYFVWPREPTLRFIAAGLKDGTTANYTSTSIEANWIVNFTVLNSESWIPTQMKDFAINVIEGSSGEIVGSGHSGHVVLKPRSIDQIVTIPILIQLTRDATNPTLKTLLSACSVLNEDLSSPLPKQTLDIRFRVSYYISGIIWHNSGDVIPESYFQCPS